MKDDAGRSERSAGRVGHRADIKRELRAMFAQVDVSLSAELIADRRRVARREDGPSPSRRSDNRG
jgi:hypothetical protein